MTQFQRDRFQYDELSDPMFQHDDSQGGERIGGSGIAIFILCLFFAAYLIYKLYAS